MLVRGKESTDPKKSALISRTPPRELVKNTHRLGVGQNEVKEGALREGG